MKPGSFNWYLYRSGTFVTLMASAIQRADRSNKDLLRKSFPQMCAAHDCNSWDEVPEGFEPVYDALMKHVPIEGPEADARFDELREKALNK
jgi:hypothetical protein